MKELQNKLKMLVVSSILISAFLVLMIAFFYYNRFIKNNSEQILQLMCSEKRQTIDEKLLNVEQSVHTLYNYIKELVEGTDDLWQNQESIDEHISLVKSLMLTSVKYTDGAVSVYYRLNPDICGAKQGVWLLKEETGSVVEHEVTDLLQYEKDDIEHVGWYYIPIENGKETWLQPYYNKNLDLEMISYVIPIFVDNKVIGVVGIDIDTELLYENTKSVSVYDTGYAFLIDNGGIFVYHPEKQMNSGTIDFEEENANLYEKSLLAVENQSIENYRWNGSNKKMAVQELRNGMLFAVCVGEQEIWKPQHLMLLHSAIMILITMTVFITATVSVTKAIVKLLYTDAMTKVGNKTAYIERTDLLHKQIKEKEKISFAIVVLDINDLKKKNDAYGHEYGDKLIQHGAEIISKVWGADATYRIGGDEFAVVLSEKETEHVQREILLIEEAITEFNHQRENDVSMQMAIGMAVYDPETDRKYSDVFKRADVAMYDDKRRKKERNSFS